MAAAGPRFVMPYQRAENALGVPMPQAKLYFYVGDTTTLATTYSDADLTIPNTNPVVALDSGLFPNIFLDPSIDYKSRLTTAAGVEQWTAYPNAGGGGSASDVLFTQGGTGALTQPVQTRMRQEAVLVTDYEDGVGDGSTVTDDAWNNALAWCSFTGQALYAPGTADYYKVTAPIPVPQGVTIFGDGYNSRVKQVTVDQNLFVPEGENEFTGLHIQGSNSNTVTDPFANCGVYAVDVNNISVHDCWLSGFYCSATFFQGTHNVRVQNNTFFQNYWPQTGVILSFAACADVCFYSLLSNGQTGGRLIATGNYHYGQMSAAVFFNATDGDQGAVIANNYIQPLDADWQPILSGMVNRHGIAVDYGGNAATQDTLCVVQANVIRYVRWAGIYCQSNGQNTGAMVIDANVTDHTGIDDASVLGGGIRVATGTAAPVIISNNSITEHRGAQTGGITIQTTYESASAGRVTIQGNAITRCLGHGIDLVQINQNIDIFDNQIIDCGQNDILFEQFGVTQADAYRVRIMRNRIVRANATTYSIYVYGAVVTNYTVIIQDNWMVGSSKTTPTTALNSAVYFANTNVMHAFQLKDNHFEKYYRAITAGGYFPAGRHANNIVIDGNDFLDCTYGIDFSAIANTATILVTNSTWNGVTNNFGTALLSGYPCLYEGVRNGALFNVNSAAAPTTGTWIDGDAWTCTAPAVASAPGGICTTPGATGVFVFTALAVL